jgi:RNA-binding protein YlmH
MSDAMFRHFHPDEQPFVRAMLDKMARVAHGHMEWLSDFYDPRQQFIVESLVHRETALQVQFFGGYDGAERKRAWMAPEYLLFDPSSPLVTEAISVLAIQSLDERLSDYRHGDYLGSLLGLGIKREKVGDIHPNEVGCHVLICAEMADFVRLHLLQVGRARVQVDILALQQLTVTEPPLQVQEITVASLRLDGVISDVYHLSRSKAMMPIKAGKCKVNWRLEEQSSHLLKAGDVVSVQGFGRFKVIEVRGMTKKGNIRLKIGKFV